MYARLITSLYQLDKLDEGIQLYRESILPELKQLPGFKGVLGMVDRSKGKAIALTLWESEADLLASGEGSAYMQASLANLPPYLSHRLSMKRMRSDYKNNT